MFYTFVVALCVIEYFDAFPRWTNVPFDACWPSRRRMFFVACICALPLALALHLNLLGAMERAQRLSGQIALPYPVIDITSAALIASRAPYTPALFAIALIETVALWAVARHLSAQGSKRMEWILVAIVSVLLAGIALSAPALSNGDLYAYIGYGLLNERAFSPPGTPFGGEFASINTIWGTPIPPSVYGPLWVAFNAWCLHSAGTLLEKIHVLQTIGFVCVLALTALLRSCGLKPATCALVLLNPFLYLQFVTNAHNDIQPVILTVAAFAIARRSPLGAVPVAIAAGAIKIPFVAIGALAFARTSPAARRITLAALSILGGLAIIVAYHGGAYSRAVFAETSATSYNAAYSFLLAPPHLFAAAIALAAICAVLLGRRVPRSALLALSTLATQRSAYYGIWCLPFALADELLMTRLLLGLPAFGFFLERVVDVRRYQFCALAALLLLALFGIIQKRQRSRKQMPQF